MDKTAIIQKLATYKISTKLIEQILSIPLNNLSKWLKNPEKMPDKHAKSISVLITDIEFLRPDTENLGTFIDSVIRSAIGSLQRIVELEAEIAALRPAADSWNQRMALTEKALKTAPEAILTTTGDAEDVFEKIKVIQAEKIPKERDTPIGRRSWQIDQQKRINELKKQYHDMLGQ